jgi:hypothetical protein
MLCTDLGIKFFLKRSMLCITEIKTAVQVTENVVTEEFKIN